MSNQFINQQQDGGFQTLAEVLQRASNARDNKPEKTEATKKFELKITPEKFESDFNTKTIATSEICEKLTERLGSVFSDYVGCKDIIFTNSPQIGISLVFEYSNSNNDQDTRIKAVERFGLDNIGENATTKELEMVSRFNGISSIKAAAQNGNITETTMGIRLSNDAIEILKDIVINFIGGDNKNHDNFRKQCISYGLSSDGINSCIIVNGATVESVLGFIYGDQYDYAVIPGAPVSTNNYFGRLLEVKQLHPDVTKKLLKKYVSRQVVNDGLYRPIR